MRASSALVLVLVLGTGATVLAATLEPLPASLTGRWLTSLRVKAGWEAPGYDTTGWVRAACDLPGAYPEWMTPTQQARYRFLWHPSGANRGKPVYFRRPLHVSGRVTTARFALCADDQFKFYVNGHLQGTQTVAHQTRDYEVAPLLRPGANLLAAEARDVQAPGYGLLVVGEVTQEWPFVRQQKSWRCATKATAGWNRPDYDDRKWAFSVADRAPAIVVPEGTYACFTTPREIGDFASAYFRRCLDLDGLPTAASITILGDDSYDLYVNGRRLALERRVDRAYRPARVDVTAALHPGRNVLAVKITNTWGPARLYCLPKVTLAL